MAAPTIVSSSVVAEQTAANPVYTAPAGIADGDWLVIWHFIFNATAPSPTPPTGFAAAPGTWPIHATDGSTNFYQYCWIKKASGESGNYTVTQPTTGATRGLMFAVRGADGTTPMTPTPSQNSGHASGTTTTYNSITTSVANELVCLLGSDDNDNATTYAVTGFTLQAHTGGECLLTATQATAGAVGTKTMTNEGASNTLWIGVMAAFQPSTGSSVTGSATLAATAAVSATGSVASGPTGSATLAATLGATATGQTVHRAHGTLAGTLALSATGRAGKSAHLNAALGLTASGSVVGSGPGVTGSATLAGTLGMSAGGILLRSGQATLAGALAMSASATVRHQVHGSATLAGALTLSGAPHRTRSDSATLAATLALTATGSVSSAGVSGQATLAATLGLTANALTSVTGATSLAGQLGLSATPHVVRATGATLHATLGMSAKASVRRNGAATLGATLAIQASGLIAGSPTGVASLSAHLTTTARGATFHRASATAMSTALTVAAGGHVQRNGHAVLQATATLAATGNVSAPFTLNATLGLSASAVVSRTKAATLSVTLRVQATGRTTGILDPSHGRKMRWRPIEPRPVRLR